MAPNDGTGSEMPEPEWFRARIDGHSVGTESAAPGMRL